ncbi:MAG TPA: hypothetical protein EYN66_06750 [Myxococcales bacterium]|nr:hypothetical protein [Myxococcales bacterium]
MVEKLVALPDQLGALGAMLADSGYYSEDNVKLCEDTGITPYIAQSRQKHNQPFVERFGPAPEPPDDAAPMLAKMQYRMKTKDGKPLYALRKCTVETVIGIIKHGLGFRTLLLRGQDLVEAEWSIVCSAWNLKRMHAMIA